MLSPATDMKSQRVIAIISLQFILIGLISWYFIYKKQNILGENVVINPISKETIDQNTTSHLTSFYEPKPNTIEKVNDWGPYNGMYTINADTFNERFDYVVEKPKGIYRIITLGDSYTYGLYVNTPQNWPEQLEDLLNNTFTCPTIQKFEVINLGVQGYDIQYAVERFRIRGQKYNPDYVLFLIKTDDVVQVNEVMLPILKQIGKINNYNGWNKAMQESYNKLGNEASIQWQVNAFSTFLQMYSGDGAVLTFPHVKKFPEEVFQSTLMQTKMHFHYLPDIYKNKDFYYGNDYHPTVSGHKVIAEDVFHYLTQNNIIPCN